MQKCQPRSIFEKRNVVPPSLLLPGGNQVDGHFHTTYGTYPSDAFHASKLKYSPGLLHAALKPPTLTGEPEHFILGTKCQKVMSLEAFKVFAFLSSCYHSVPSWGLLLHLKEKQRLLFLILFPQPSSYLCPVPSAPSQHSSSSPSPAPQHQLTQRDVSGKHCLFLKKWRDLNT